MGGSGCCVLHFTTFHHFYSRGLWHVCIQNYKHPWTLYFFIFQGSISNYDILNRWHKHNHNQLATRQFIIIFPCVEQELVPCVLLSFDDEQILMWRGHDWKSMYPDTPTALMISSDDSGTHCEYFSISFART